MSEIKDVSTDQGHADDLGNTKADEELGLEKKEPKSTHSDNSHKRFALLRGGLKSLVAVTTFLLLHGLHGPSGEVILRLWFKNFFRLSWGQGEPRVQARTLGSLGAGLIFLSARLIEYKINFPGSKKLPRFLSSKIKLTESF